MSLPSFDPEDLRDHADPARVERIWSRLEADLHEASVGELRGRAAVPLAAGRASRSGRSRSGALLVAAALGAFGVGLVVGRGDRPVGAGVPEATATHESVDAILAAGTRARTFSLPGGGAVTLAPGGTIEVGEVDGGVVTLRLVQGEARLETAGASTIAVEAGDARVSTLGETSLSLRREEDALDVEVQGGVAEVEGPEGRRTLRRGERAKAATVTSIAVAPEPRPAPSPELRAPDDPPRLLVADAPPPAEVAPAPAPVSAPSWLSLYDGARPDEAMAAIEGAGGIATVIDQSRTARELMALDHLARKKGQTILAMRALTRVATEFPDDPNAQAAAMTLGNLHRRAGNEALAAQYYELAKNSAFGEDVACRRLTALEPGGAGAAEAAQDYLAKYPEGRCRETAEDLLGEPAAEAPEGAPRSEGGDAPPEPKDDAPAAPTDAPPPPSEPK